MKTTFQSRSSLLAGENCCLESETAGKEKRDAGRDGAKQNSQSHPRNGERGPSLAYTKHTCRRKNELSTPWELFLQILHKELD